MTLQQPIGFLLVLLLEFLPLLTVSVRNYRKNIGTEAAGFFRRCRFGDGEEETMSSAANAGLCASTTGKASTGATTGENLFSDSEAAAGAGPDDPGTKSYVGTRSYGNFPLASSLEQLRAEAETQNWNMPLGDMVLWDYAMTSTTGREYSLESGDTGVGAVGEDELLLLRGPASVSATRTTPEEDFLHERNYLGPSLPQRPLVPLMQSGKSTNALSTETQKTEMSQLCGIRPRRCSGLIQGPCNALRGGLGVPCPWPAPGSSSEATASPQKFFELREKGETPAESTFDSKDKGSARASVQRLHKFFFAARRKAWNRRRNLMLESQKNEAGAVGEISASGGDREEEHEYEQDQEDEERAGSSYLARRPSLVQHHDLRGKKLTQTRGNGGKAKQEEKWWRHWSRRKQQWYWTQRSLGRRMKLGGRARGGGGFLPSSGRRRPRNNPPRRRKGRVEQDEYFFSTDLHSGESGVVPNEGRDAISQKPRLRSKIKTTDGGEQAPHIKLFPTEEPQEAALLHPSPRKLPQHLSDPASSHSSRGDTDVDGLQTRSRFDLSDPGEAYSAEAARSRSPQRTPKESSGAWSCSSPGSAGSGGLLGVGGEGVGGEGARGWGELEKSFFRKNSSSSASTAASTPELLRYNDKASMRQMSPSELQKNGQSHSPSPDASKDESCSPDLDPLKTAAGVPVQDADEDEELAPVSPDADGGGGLEPGPEPAAGRSSSPGTGGPEPAASSSAQTALGGGFLQLSEARLSSAVRSASGLTEQASHLQIFPGGSPLDPGPPLDPGSPLDPGLGVFLPLSEVRLPGVDAQGRVIQGHEEVDSEGSTADGLGGSEFSMPGDEIGEYEYQEIGGDGDGESDF